MRQGGNQRGGRSGGERTEESEATLSETVRTLRAVLTGDDQLSGTLRTATGHVEALNTAFGTVAKLLVAGEFARGIRSCVDSFAESERVTQKFQQALRASGQEVYKTSEAFQSFATQMQRTTTNSDEAVISAASLLTSVGKLSGEGLERATRASADLAEGLGIDLTSAAMLLSKAAEGNTAALGRYGIKVDEALQGSDAFAEVLRQVEGRFGGMAEAAGSTTQGAIKQLANAFDDLKEKIGGAAVGAGLADSIRDVTDSLKALNDGDILGAINNLKTLAGIAPLNPAAWGASATLRASNGSDIGSLPVGTASGRLPAPGNPMPSGQAGIDLTLQQGKDLGQYPEWRQAIADMIEYYKSFDEVYDKEMQRLAELAGEYGKTQSKILNDSQGMVDEEFNQWLKTTEAKVAEEEKSAETIAAIRARLAEKSAQMNDDYAARVRQGNIAILQSSANFAETAFGDSKAGALASAAISEAASIAGIWEHWAWNPAIAGVLTALSVATFAAQISKINSTEFKGHAFGGVIPGVDNGKDTYPALLRPGEAVLPPELVNAVMSGSGGGAITIEATGDLGMLMAAMNAKVKSGSATLIASKIGTGSRTVR